MTAINVAIATKLLIIAKDVTSKIDVTIANDLTNTRDLPIANNLIIANDVTSTKDAASAKYLTSALDHASANNVTTAKDVTIAKEVTILNYVTITKDVTACSQPFILAVLQPCSKAGCNSERFDLFLPGCAVLSGRQPRGNHHWWNHPREEKSAASLWLCCPSAVFFSCPQVVGRGSQMSWLFHTSGWRASNASPQARSSQNSLLLRCITPKVYYQKQMPFVSHKFKNFRSALSQDRFVWWILTECSGIIVFRETLIILAIAKSFLSQDPSHQVHSPMGHPSENDQNLKQNYISCPWSRLVF